MTRLVRATSIGCLTLTFVIGCSSRSANQPGELSKEEQAILHVAQAYRDASSTLQRGPTSEKELKPYLKQYGDPDQLLVSPNDGQPYQFVWGLVPMRPTKGARGQPFLVYEKTGKDGKRYVVDLMLKVHHLNDKELSSMKQGPN